MLRPGRAADSLARYDLRAELGIVPVGAAHTARGMRPRRATGGIGGLPRAATTLESKDGQDILWDII